MDIIGNNLRTEFEAVNFKFKVFKAEHIKEISTEYEKLVAQGLLEEAFYNNNLIGFDYDYESKLKNVKSVIVIAARQCKSLAEFEYEGRVIEVTIPPTYLYPVINDQIERIMEKVIAKGGYSFTKAILPLKLLAARSGLGQYGRNNIFYIPGKGSFFRLTALFTDYEFREDNWGEIKVMNSCNSCTICIDSCPTGAIKRDRFLIQAQNCITNFNEYDTPIPEWIHTDWHNSIVGCMKCQEACPYNSKFIDLVDERIGFNEKETSMILSENNLSDLPKETRDKIFYAGMEPYYRVLPRNIRLIINGK